MALEQIDKTTPATYAMGSIKGRGFGFTSHDQGVAVCMAVIIKFAAS